MISRISEQIRNSKRSSILTSFIRMPSHLFSLVLINGLLLIAGFYSPLYNAHRTLSRSQKQRSFSCNMADDAIVNDEEQVEAYLGPTSDFDDMEAGCSIGDIGIQVMVGPSLIGAGRGLFVSILDEVDEVVLPAGTPICGYSKGDFRSEADGDKSVAYLFGNPYTGIIFEKKLMPLLDAIGIVEDKVNADQNVTVSAFKSINKRKNKYKIAEGVIGHIMSFNETSNDIEIHPDLEYLERYFIPDEETNNTVWGPGRLGMYANDLAYYEGVTEEIYDRNSPALNVLQIAWRMEMQNQTLVPTWPVVITMGDVLLTNRIPMELGLQYSFRYWKSVQEAMIEAGMEVQDLPSESESEVQGLESGSESEGQDLLPESKSEDPVWNLEGGKWVRS